MDLWTCELYKATFIEILDFQTNELQIYILMLLFASTITKLVPRTIYTQSATAWRGRCFTPCAHASTIVWVIIVWRCIAHSHVFYVYCKHCLVTWMAMEKKSSFHMTIDKSCHDSTQLYKWQWTGTTANLDNSQTSLLSTYSINRCFVNDNIKAYYV